MIDFVKKHCCWTVPTITIIIFVIINSKKSLVDVDYDANTIIQIAGTLIGFLFTAITILVSLPKDTEYMKRIKRIGHNKIMGRCVYLGIFILTLDIIVWLVESSNWIVALFFIIGLEETLMAAYYIYRLCMDNF